MSYVALQSIMVVTNTLMTDTGQLSTKHEKLDMTASWLCVVMSGGIFPFRNVGQDCLSSLYEAEHLSQW